MGGRVRQPVVERFILSLKREFFRTPPLGGRAPAEVRDRIVAARERVRFEPRARVPVARGDPSVKRREKLTLVVS